MDKVISLAREAGLRMARLLLEFGTEDALCDSELKELESIRKFYALARADLEAQLEVQGVACLSMSKKMAAIEAECERRKTQFASAEFAVNELKAENAKWKSVFGHLGTADECGNEWIALQVENANLRIALKEIEWSNSSEWQADRARAALGETNGSNRT